MDSVHTITPRRDLGGLFAALADRGPDAVLVTTPDGVISYANARAASLLKRDADGLTGTPLTLMVEGAEPLLAPGALERSPQSLRLCVRDTSRVLSAHVSRVADATGESQLLLVLSSASEVEQRLARHALHDSLTGLANRALFGAQLALALARGGSAADSVAVLLLDIDRFKSINDVLGHKAGDELITAFGGRLTGTLPPPQLVARLGGDEFAILYPELRNRDEAVRTAAAIVEFMKLPFELQGEEVRVSASVGVAFSSGSETATDQLLADADTALYRAKRAGRAQYAVLDSDARVEGTSRRARKLALPAALERDEFALAFEPIVPARGDVPAAYEALPRWLHPKLGPLMPADFLDLAEEIGLIVPIERWVMATACATAAGWRGAKAEAAVSVNLSHRYLLLSRLVSYVTGELERSGLPPHRLRIEVPPTVLTDDDPFTLASFEELAGRGVEFVLNEFGDGTCNLDQLKQWPISAVKLKRGLVHSALDSASGQSVLVATVQIAHALGARAVAKAVESQAELDAAASAGCDFAQGHYLSARCTAATNHDGPRRETPEHRSSR